MDISGQVISRAQAEQRMFEKLERPDFLTDVKPLLTAEEATLHRRRRQGAFAVVFRELFSRSQATVGEYGRQNRPTQLADLLAA